MAINKLNLKDGDIVTEDNFKTIDDNFSELNTNRTEILNALDDHTTQLNQNVQDINSLKTNKANQSDLTITNVNVTQNTNNINTLKAQVSSLASGSPKAVSLVANMTDTTKNYVYTGSESGYTSGNWYYYNGSAWVSGGVYQSTGIGNNSISTEATDFATSIKQTLDASKCTKGLYYNGSSVGSTSSATGYMIIKIKLTPGIYCGNCDENFSFSLSNNTLTKLSALNNYKKYKNTSSGLSYDYFNIFEVPSNSEYMYLTFRYGYSNMLNAMLFYTIENLEPVRNYSYGEYYSISIANLVEPLAESLKNKVDSIVDLNTTNIIVKSDGTGDYTSLVTAVNSITDFSKKTTIDIYTGDYDLLDELGGDTFLSSVDGTSNRCGLKLMNNIELIGHGNVTLKLEIPDAKATSILSTNVSALELYGNIYIENITITSKNTRYTIHDETGNNYSYAFTKHIFKNCKILHEGTSLWGAPIPYASGTSTGCQYEFIDCIFTATNNIYAWSMHNNENQNTLNVTFDGCVFNGKYTQDNSNIKFGYYKSNWRRNNVFIKNCIIPDGYIVKQEDSTVASDNVWDVYDFDKNKITIGTN